MVNLGISIYGAVQLKVDFDPSWYLDQNSDILKMIDYVNKYFPSVNEFKGKFSLIHREQQRLVMNDLTIPDTY